MQIFPSFSPPTGQNEFMAFCSLGGLKLGKICNSEIVYLKKSRISKTQQDFVKKNCSPSQKKIIVRPSIAPYRPGTANGNTKISVTESRSSFVISISLYYVSRTNITSQSGQGLRFGLRSKRYSDWLVIFVHEITSNPVHIIETAIIHPPPSN